MQVIVNLTPLINRWLTYYSCSDLRSSRKIGLLKGRLISLLLNW